MRELLTRTPTTAVEIAALCRALPIEAAADLIQQYADTAAAGGRLEGVQEAYDNIDKRLAR